LKLVAGEHEPLACETSRPSRARGLKPLLERFIELFTDEGEVVIDPVAGSGTTLLAAKNLGRKAYGFEISKELCQEAEEKVLTFSQPNLFVEGRK